MEIGMLIWKIKWKHWKNRNKEINKSNCNVNNLKSYWWLSALSFSEFPLFGHHPFPLKILTVLPPKASHHDNIIIFSLQLTEIISSKFAAKISGIFASRDAWLRLGPADRWRNFPTKLLARPFDSWSASCVVFLSGCFGKAHPSCFRGAFDFLVVGDGWFRRSSHFEPKILFCKFLHIFAFFYRPANKLHIFGRERTKIVLICFISPVPIHPKMHHIDI